jgi:hypothetical protein
MKYNSKLTYIIVIYVSWNNMSVYSAGDENNIL